MFIVFFFLFFFFFLRIRRPPRSTLDRSSAASDVYKRQLLVKHVIPTGRDGDVGDGRHEVDRLNALIEHLTDKSRPLPKLYPVSYTHLRAHETVLDLVCRLLLEKKKQTDHY